MGKNIQPRFIPDIKSFSVSMQKKVSLFSLQKLNKYALSCVLNVYDSNSLHMACAAELVRRNNNKRIFR